MTNVFLLFAVLAAAACVRVWLARFIDADHELSDTWRQR